MSLPQITQQYNNYNYNNYIKSCQQKQRQKKQSLGNVRCTNVEVNVVTSVFMLDNNSSSWLRTKT